MTKYSQKCSVVWTSTNDMLGDFKEDGSIDVRFLYRSYMTSHCRKKQHIESPTSAYIFYIKVKDKFMLSSHQCITCLRVHVFHIIISFQWSFLIKICKYVIILKVQPHEYFHSVPYEISIKVVPTFEVRIT